MKRSMMALFFIMAVPALAFAGQFEKLIWIRNSYHPKPSQLDRLKEECKNAEIAIEDKITQVASMASIALEQLEVNHKILFSDPDISGPTYSCYVNVTGLSSHSVKFIQLSKRKDHLKRKGYRKSEFPAACSDIEKTFSANPNEIFQATVVSYALLNGNYCGVRSVVMISNP